MCSICHHPTTKVGGYQDDHLVCLLLKAPVQLSDGFSKFASAIGLEPSDRGFDEQRFRESAQQLCRVRTGFNFPENYLVSAMPEADVARLFPE